MYRTTTKSLFASKTFWGAVISGVAGILPFLGIVVPAAGTLDAMASLLAIIGGAGLAIYGRVKADKMIEG